MDKYIDNLESTVLNFGTEKRSTWEKEHKLYSVHFEVTPRCNFRCVHCYLQKNHNDNELSFEDVISIIDMLYERGVLFITFTGGEIFSRRDFMDIYMYAKQKGFIIELFTNGMLIDEKIINILGTYPPLLVDITLYGASNKTYEKVTGIPNAFERVVSNCKKMITSNIRVALKSPMLTFTMPEIDDMKKLADTLGVTFRASFEIVPAIDKDEITRLYQLPIETMLRYEFSEAIKHRTGSNEFQLERQKDTSFVNLKIARPLFRCKIGAGSCVIDYEGNLFPCMKYRHIGKRISPSSFDSIWENLRKYQQMQASAEYRCLSCDAYNYCDLCPAEMDSLYGNLEYIDNVQCRIAHARKAFYENGLSITDAMAQYSHWA